VPSARIPLRIAAGVFLLFALGHTYGFLQFQPVSEQGRGVLEQMKHVSFDFGGTAATWWGLYEGFGLSVSIGLILSMILSWRLSRGTADPSLARTVAWLLCGTQLANAAICFAFFGPIQMVFSIAAAGALAWSGTSLRAEARHVSNS
jgi:hypothetical protein